MRESLDRVLDQFRPGFDADGFDVAVESASAAGVVVVRVHHRPDACEECLIPDDLLTQMLTSAMREAVPDVTRVEIRHEMAA